MYREILNAMVPFLSALLISCFVAMVVFPIDKNAGLILGFLTFGCLAVGSDSDEYRKS